MPQGWGDSQPCTDSARIDVSDTQVGTKKRALRSNQETEEGKLRRLANSLTTKTPYKGPGADSGEKHEPASDIDTAVVDSLKALDLKRPIREADMLCPTPNDRFVPKPEISPKAKPLDAPCVFRAAEDSTCLGRGFATSRAHLVNTSVTRLIDRCR